MSIQYTNHIPREMMFEYTGTVTQLGATSEVAVIGFLLTCPLGERIVFNVMRITMSDTGAGETVDVLKEDTNGAIIENWASVSLDNQSINVIAQRTISNTTDVVNVHGYGREPIIGGNQRITVRVASTMGASETFAIRLTYFSTKLPLAITPIGSGISLSSEDHLNV